MVQVVLYIKNKTYSKTISESYMTVILHFGFSMSQCVVH